MLTVAAFAIAACGDGGGDEPAAAAPPPPGGGTNQAPTISGTPATSVMQNTAYSFTPSASDSNGDTLTFSIVGKPAWAVFDTATGTLSGTPTAGDVANYQNIRISVSDGQAVAVNLPTFAINVVATATGAATLTWNPPTQNTDGSPATLAGYRIYWGTTQNSYPNMKTLNGAGFSSTMIDQLTPAKWYFVVTAFDVSGNESAYSNVASKTVM
jgi:hypothetical protein